MSSIEEVKSIRLALERGLKLLIRQVGKVSIGNTKQFPYGWGKAAKGRTVWRILEELVTQNLKKNCSDYGFASVEEADSEVGVFDFECVLAGSNTSVYVNIKSAIQGGRQNKDDISKANSLIQFYRSDPERDLFVATMCIAFHVDMTIELVDVFVVPIAWLADIYVNPSNNGNLQSSKYKNLSDSIQRTNMQFIDLLEAEVEVARTKRAKKAARK